MLRHPLFSKIKSKQMKNKKITHLHTRWEFSAIRKDRSTGEETIIRIEDMLHSLRNYWKIDDGLMDDFIQGNTLWTPYAEYRISH
jgi:hypothetical protein